MVPDRAGVLRDVAGVLAEFGISVAQAVQKGQADVVPLVFMTHQTSARSVSKAVERLHEARLLIEQAVCYRVLGH
jgi:homoserine dehydrogenase